MDSIVRVCHYPTVMPTINYLKKKENILTFILFILGERKRKTNIKDTFELKIQRLSESAHPSLPV